ncbi:tetratricopeptide repeat protein [Flavimarina sp. Hel_I_48]|uniref:tetratricopeptide repeat protein n=1 Tax=Flavimarina sp. Hel_I_48 TaxID=1392488 RepID=UPI0004DF0455|nr:tetratricopeptide repeat protein [Flavimarina sp. Hel_I_48]
MATYNKRGGKPKTKPESVDLDDFDEDDSTTAEVFSNLDEGANRTEEWVVKNQKAIFIIVGAIALLVLAYLAYGKFIEEPRELEASNEMYQAQNYFNDAINGAAAKDSLYGLALNGGEGKYGFLDIIDNYGGSKAGNLAQYYAGMAYLNTNKYQEAIDYLEDFNSDDDELMLAPLAKGGIGDAFMQLNQPEQALDYYEQAAKIRTNDFTTPRFLMKAALTALELKDNAKAEEFLNRIQEEYPDSPAAVNVPLYMGMAKASN